MVSPTMIQVAMIAMHTSPLDQPGMGDSGGMNVYVHEFASSLAQAGVHTTVYSRASLSQPAGRRVVEPLYEVVHLEVGALDLDKEALISLVEPFADAVEEDLRDRDRSNLVVHAHYWLSGAVAHILKHRLGVPMVNTFHTLARVKEMHGDVESPLRARVEGEIVGCSDVVCAANRVERDQLIELYGADPTRVEIVAPGVHHAFFSPGDAQAARHALHWSSEPRLLFVGRIQPLKGLDIAIEALAELRHTDARLVVIGGPSGVEGRRHFEAVLKRAADLGVSERIDLLPPQPHHLLSTFYRAADITLMPSRSESFGLVALESMACGTPVVAAAVGGLVELVAGSGHLVATRSASDWARAIDTMLDTPAMRDELAKHAARRGNEFSWSSAAGRLRRAYADVIQRQRVVSCASGN